MQLDICLHGQAENNRANIVQRNSYQNGDTQYS
jgi:hypothetical protein